ncbi:MAG: DEAD/DEAH box helicase [Thermodesulfobacteriota bacterium]
MQPRRPAIRAKKRSGAKSTHVGITPGADRKLDKVFAAIGVPDPEPFTPDPFQLQALAAIEKSDCLVTAPTGAGKTWIAEQAIARILSRGGKSWYASPLKALSNSKYADFSALFGARQVGILTGDRKENPDAPVIVGTTEILRNQLYDAMSEGGTLAADFVVLDEAHFLGDRDRGVVWEEIMIYLPPRIPLLMLSATIGNAPQIAHWLSAIRTQNCKVVQAHQRPVPLFPLFFHPSGILYPLLSDGGASGGKKLYKKVEQYLKTRTRNVFTSPHQLPPYGAILEVLKTYNLLPAIFFLKSRADCDRAVERCTQNRIRNRRHELDLRERIGALLDNNPHLSHHRQRRYLEQFAVGAHHSGQLPAWKLVLENLMTEGLLDAVFATSTVAAGVNFPARTMVFFNSDRFNGTEFQPLSPTEFHQMTGRAGRRGKDHIGFAMAVPGRFMDARLVAGLIHAPSSNVESQIRINFSMVLNLLLSHTPGQIEDLLKKSFATYLIQNGGKKKVRAVGLGGHRVLWREFLHHLNFLIENGYVAPDGKLEKDGIWASRLRIDQPLMVAEGFRRDLLPTADPELLAAVMGAFVNEREPDDRIDRKFLSKKLTKTFHKVRRGLRPFGRHLLERGFKAVPLFLRPAATLYLWATGQPWEVVLAVSEIEEGDLAMLILRTADNLRHIRALEPVFPEAAETAGSAIERILREPVVMDYDG